MKKCDYCGPLGLGMDTHDRKWCYIDPQSAVYKPDVRTRRIQQAVRKGVTLPAYLQDEQPSRIGMMGPDSTMVRDVQGALRLLGMLSEDEVQAQTDEIVNSHQA